MTDEASADDTSVMSKQDGSLVNVPINYPVTQSDDDIEPPTTPKQLRINPTSIGPVPVSPLQSPSSYKYRQRSPVNLPIRSGGPSRLDKVDEYAPLPSSRQTSPKRAELLNESPTKDRPGTQFANSVDYSPGRASLASVVRDYPDPTEIRDVGDPEADEELIFDDTDQRLPPPVPSPRQDNNSSKGTVLAISSPELPPDEFNDMDEGGDGPLAQQVFGSSSGEIMSPRNVDYSTEQRGSGVFYPAPVPMQLMLPPLLSARSKAKVRDHPGLRRPKSGIAIDIPEPPHWDPSPLETELQYISKQRIQGDTASLDSVPVGNIVDEDEDEYADSDRATIMSDEDRDQFDDPLDAPFEGPVPSGSPQQQHKRRTWLGRTWEAFIGKDGRWEDKDGNKNGSGYDNEEQEVLRAQMRTIDDDFAFTRLDPELVQHHAEMFHAGGVHSSTVPISGKPTSLIEEIEIRKAGKKVQQQLLLRETAENERQRLHELRQGGRRHPVDAVGAAQPTLLRLQQLADADYRQRVEWHQRAINKNQIQDYGNETLAQRRARMKEAKLAKKQALTDIEPQETLGQRRERLRKARLAAAGHGSGSVTRAQSIRTLSLSGEDNTSIVPSTPEQPAESSAEQLESPEFDMVHAVATMPSPTSQAFVSPSR